MSTWYPSVQTPTQAPFNHEHVRAIQSDHTVRVVHVRLRSSAAAVTETFDGVHVSRISLDLKRPWSVLTVLTSLRREMRHADVLHSMAFSTILMVLPVWLVTRMPWVHTEHWNGVTNPASVGPLWRRFAWLRNLLRFPHVVTGVTTQLTERLQHFARPAAARVVPCVVDNNRPLRPWSRGEVLKLVAVGGLVPRKRPLLAVDTVNWLTDRGEDATLQWIGAGVLEREVLEHASALGISQRIQLRGAVPPEEVFPGMEEADIFFLPSEQENFFTAAAEALSCGRPVVAALAGGYDDYCDSTNSVLVERPTAENLGLAILEATALWAGRAPTEIALPIRERFNSRVVGGLFTEAYAAARYATQRGALTERSEVDG
ncbi:glycosyltransferase [Arthrobacter sp. RIT-PI-e]|uniref:glycosyltransferase n=1 Tax=Arthrobacter sp. RIT-PI-e TaxID=1681197 RepID=UPI0013648857|nr:glycosyltransferase [Arthrobacter sp. RIT-PI-e]